MTGYLAVATAAFLCSYSIPQFMPGQVEFASVKLHVVVSRYEGERETSSEPFDFRLRLNQAGTLQVGTEINMDTPPSAWIPCPDFCGTTNLVGTRVTSKVEEVTTEDFRVMLTILDQTFAGCRPVGDLSIPTFSTKNFSRSLRLRAGETTESVIEADIARNISTRVSVTLERI